MSVKFARKLSRKQVWDGICLKEMNILFTLFFCGNWKDQKIFKKTEMFGGF